MEQENNRLKLGTEEAKGVFTSVIKDLTSAAQFGGFFKNGIELIKVEVDVGKSDAIVTVKVVVAGKDGVAGANALDAQVSNKVESEPMLVASE